MGIRRGLRVNPRRSPRLMEDVVDGTFERCQRLQLVGARIPAHARWRRELRDPSSGILARPMQRWRINVESCRIWGYRTLVPVEVEPRLGIHTRIPVHYPWFWRQGQTWVSAHSDWSPCQRGTRRRWKTGRSRIHQYDADRLMPRWRSGAEGVAMARMMLHGFKLVRPTKVSSSGVRMPLDVSIEIEAMVVTSA